MAGKTPASDLARALRTELIEIDKRGAAKAIEQAAAEAGVEFGEAMHDTSILAKAKELLLGERPTPKAVADVVPESVARRLELPPSEGTPNALVRSGERSPMAGKTVDLEPSSSMEGTGGFGVVGKMRRPTQLGAAARTPGTKVVDADVEGLSGGFGGAPPAEAAEAASKSGMSMGKKVAIGAGVAALASGSTRDSSPPGVDPGLEIEDGSVSKPTGAPKGSDPVKDADPVKSVDALLYKPLPYSGPKMPGKPTLESADTTNEMADALAEQRKDLQIAARGFATAKDDLERREMWEQIVHGLGTMFAGLHGLKTGQDLSGVKFNAKNWLAKQQLEQAEWQSRKDDIQSNYKAQITRIGAKRQDALDRNAMVQAGFDNDAKLFQTGFAQWKETNDQSATAAKLGLEGRKIGEDTRHNTRMEDITEGYYNKIGDASQVKAAAAAANAGGKADKQAQGALDNFNKAVSEGLKGQKSNDRQAAINKAYGYATAYEKMTGQPLLTGADGFQGWSKTDVNDLAAATQRALSRIRNGGAVAMPSDAEIAQFAKDNAMSVEQVKAAIRQKLGTQASN